MFTHNGVYRYGSAAIPDIGASVRMVALAERENRSADRLAGSVWAQLVLEFLRPLAEGLIEQDFPLLLIDHLVRQDSLQFHYSQYGVQGDFPFRCQWCAGFHNVFGWPGLGSGRRRCRRIEAQQVPHASGCGRVVCRAHMR